MIISRIQVLNYGCLRYVDVPMGRFHVLIGPNATGKSTLMDAIKFVSDVVRDGVDAACFKRTSNFQDLVWGRPTNPEDQRFEIALEFALPADIKGKMPQEHPYETFRYEMAVGATPETQQVTLLEERGALLTKELITQRQLVMFPEETLCPHSLMRRNARGRRTVFSKRETGRSRFNDETVKESGSVNWNLGLNLSSDRSAMSILPDYDEKYPASTRVMVHLRDQIIALSLNSERMRQASRPGVGIELHPDGSNIPWVADVLLNQEPELADEWIGHIQYSLAGFKSVQVIDRPDDRHKYLMLKYSNGLEVPSWKASDGTLRFMALTLLAYMPQATGLYMIEEPENGIHPGALQSVFHSLSSVYDGQVLLATHSPEFVGFCEVEDLLCFAKTSEGVVDIVQGPHHPHLREWKKEFSLGTFYASGILA